MASTPREAIEEMLTVGLQDGVENDTEELRRRLLASATYPLFQGMPDGSKEWRTLDDELVDILRTIAGPRRRVEILSEEVIAETANEGELNKRIFDSWWAFREQAIARAPYAEQGFMNARGRAARTRT